MKRLLLIAALALPMAHAQSTLTVERIAPDCAGQDFLTSLTSGCLSPRLKVTAHPLNANIAGVFILVTYKSLIFGLPVAQTQFTMARDQSGDFYAVIPSGDMNDIVVSAVGVTAADLSAVAVQ